MRHYYYSYQSIGGDPSLEKWSLLRKVTVILWQSWFCLQIYTTSEPKHIIKSNSSQVLFSFFGVMLQLQSGIQLLQIIKFYM